MSDVKLSWALPTVSPKQKAVLYTEISVRISPTLPWQVQDQVAPDVAQELIFFDVAPGDHFYRGVVFDVDGIPGGEATTSISVPFDPPGVITAFTAVLQ